MKKITGLFIAMLALAGCPGGDKNRSNNYNNLNTGPCANCSFNPAVFSQAVSSQIPQGTLTLQLSGDANQMNLWGANGMNPLFSYQGPISVAGTLNLTSVLPFGMCQLPYGEYKLRTRQAGVYNLGIFQVPMIELLDRYDTIRMVVSLVEGTILSDGNIITGLGAVLLGQQGPMMMSGWGFPQQNMSFGACSDGMGVRF